MEESVLFANGAILDMLSDVCFFFLPPSVKMELDVLRSSGHSFNVSAAEQRLKRQQKEKNHDELEPNHSYCNSSQNTKYDMKGPGELESPARRAHQRADGRTTPSFLLILEESSG